VHRILPVALLILLSACERYPDSYPPPEQRHPSEEKNAGYSMVVEMSDPGVEWRLVKDIYPPLEGVPWRWTGTQPTVRILAARTDHLKLMADFSLWPTAFKQTGAVELTFDVNGHALDKIRYTSPGDKHFERPIPPDWLMTDVESIVSIHLDKLYTAPEDGKKFGFILSRIGFVD